MLPCAIVYLILSCRALIQATSVTRTDGQDTPYLPSVFNISYITNDCSMRISENCTQLGKFCQQFRYVLLTAMNYTCYPDLTSEHEAMRSSHNYVLECGQSTNKSDILHQSCANVKDIYEVLSLIAKLRSKYPYDNIPENPGLVIEEGAILPNYANYAKYLSSLKERILEAEELLPQLLNALDYVNEKGLSRIFTSHVDNDFLKTSKIHNITEEMKMLVESGVDIVNLHIIINWVFPSIAIIQFVIGVVGNGLLLAVFIQNRSMRKINNVMFINLAVVDVVSLTVNLPISVTALSKPWWSNMSFCLIHKFLMDFPVFVSTYCVVVLSFQRYYAVSSYTSLHSHRIKIILQFATPTILLLGIVFATISLIHMHIPENSTVCIIENRYFLYISITNFLVICVIPVLLITVFSILTTILIRRSVRHFPGRKIEHDKQLGDRIATSRILVGLLLLFVVSYVPNGLFHVLGENGIMFEVKSHRELAIFIGLIYASNNMFFLNSTLNPILLYFLSKQFKTCYKSLFYCDRHSLYHPETKITEVELSN